MSGFLSEVNFETVLGGLIILFVIALIFRNGILWFLGEMAVQALGIIGFAIYLIVIFWFFVSTAIGQALGGIDTAIWMAILTPVILIVGGIIWARVFPSKDKDTQDDSDVF